MTLSDRSSLGVQGTLVNTKLHRILVAVDHTERMPVARIQKAAFLAKASGARIDLFHVIADLHPEGLPGPMTRAEVDEWKGGIESIRLNRLKDFSRSQSLAGVTVACTVAWDASPYKAIVRHAIATETDLVVAGTHPHSLGARIVSNASDWELMRQCPVPLLLVKTRRSYQDAPIVAAIDPFHAMAKPADLDEALLDAGRRWARMFSGNLHVFHAYMPLILLETAPMAVAAPMVMMPPELEPMHQRQVEAAIARLSRAARIPKVHQHLQLGHVAPELRRLATRIHAGVVVMGAVSRSGLERLLIGNTAERVLDDVPCDVLIIKPRGFRTKVLLSRTASASRIVKGASRTAGA
jgi:universal stress protein E